MMDKSKQYGVCDGRPYRPFTLYPREFCLVLLTTLSVLALAWSLDSSRALRMVASGETDSPAFLERSDAELAKIAEDILARYSKDGKPTICEPAVSHAEYPAAADAQLTIHTAGTQ